MLNLPRLRDVLKKLETTSDLARNLIKRAAIVIEPGAVAAAAIESSSTQIVTSQSRNSLASQSFITSLSYSKAPTRTPQTGTNEIKMLLYNNNNNKITEHEHEHEKHHQQQQPKTIRAALLNVSLFSRAASNGGSSALKSENSRNLREKFDDDALKKKEQSEKTQKHNQSSHNMSSETNSQGEIDVVMTQQQLKQLDKVAATTDSSTKASCNGASCGDGSSSSSGEGDNSGAAGKAKPCFKSSLADILHFMELVGNLKHTKRTGWVLRDVDDCESISGHMYRMGMMTFLLEETEGLNRIRCMELALVHDLAESLVGDLTPFCGVAKEDKKAMELKAMADICKLVEPRGKRIMELFEEYEEGQSPESKFVKDLDRLDMVMQAFEYEKRDNCLMKHQEFFDSTEGKFQHPFIQKLVKEICDQRKSLVEANIIAKGELNLKTVTPNCPPCLEHKMEHKNERS